jgi:hypothetical protein
LAAGAFYETETVKLPRGVSVVRAFCPEKIPPKDFNTY